MFEKWPRKEKYPHKQEIYRFSDLPTTRNTSKQQSILNRTEVVSI